MGPVQLHAPATWADRCRTLAAVLALVPGGGRPSRHDVSLQLAGELAHRGVAPEAIPAIVHDAAAAAGWHGERLPQIRRNAEDTVRRVLSGLAVRRDVPPGLVPAIDRVTDTVPQVPHDPAEDQRRLRLAIAEPPDGLSVIVAGCGLGKTFAAEDAAASRAHRTTISAPTNDLAVQVTEHLRARAVPVLRVFGPTSVRGPHDGWECRFHAAASALAEGKQSVRWELCEGRKKEPCPYRAECKAVDGADGPEDAKVVVGNHGLLSQLDRATGTRGVLVLDEPPQVIEDESLTATSLAEAQALLSAFEHEPARCLAPGLAVAIAWLAQGPVGEPARLGEVNPDCPGLDQLLEWAGAVDAAQAAEGAIGRMQRAPALRREEVSFARSRPARAAQLGLASKTLQQIHRALTQADVVVTVAVTHGTGERLLCVTGLDRDLHRVLRRDGSVVVMAADAGLYLDRYREVAGYDVPVLTLRARASCAVRRVQIAVRAATRSAWYRRPPAAQLLAALAIAREAGPRVAVVTFNPLTDFVRRVAPDVEVGHYYAMRGLDHWKDFDALVTLGDPRRNLDACDRKRIDPEADARAELEQAHGRLRVVHRTSPCTMVHVGVIVPAGWEEPIERYEPATGRPGRDPVDPGELTQLVGAVGGAAAAAAACGVERRTVNRWITGERGCPPDAMRALQARAADLSNEEVGRRVVT